MDTSTIAASGTDIRSLVKVVVVPAPAMDVWSAWASNEAIMAWWGPAATDIELEIGGRYEIYFTLEEPEGRRGSEGCRVLAYVPGESLAFTWNAPPHLALRETNTWVVLTFGDLGDGTSELRLVHTGFLRGSDWDAYMEYFDSAWTYVLGLLGNHWA